MAGSVTQGRGTVTAMVATMVSTVEVGDDERRLPEMTMGQTVTDQIAQNSNIRALVTKKTRDLPLVTTATCEYITTATYNDANMCFSIYRMRFKRKKDEVKALHATLQELQGIDPLDYLAKYCIIDQNKLPHYQHCFDNVDRDEDDEIDIGELDFALKAVNYDLISDSEMSYVHSVSLVNCTYVHTLASQVLELAGRYKLNFRLFSLIAALSEKVVSLE